MRSFALSIISSVISKLTSWSTTVKKGRLNRYGHLLRLLEKAPAKPASKEAKKINKKPRGGQKIRWMKPIEKDLENTTVNLIKDSINSIDFDWIIKF